MTANWHRYIFATGLFTDEETTDRLQKEIENQRQYHVQYWPFFE